MKRQMAKSPALKKTMISKTTWRSSESRKKRRKLCASRSRKSARSRSRLRLNAELNSLKLSAYASRLSKQRKIPEDKPLMKKNALGRSRRVKSSQGCES